VKRYGAFMDRHPRLAFGLVIAGLVSMILSLSGIPSDIENWNIFFQSIGSEWGRWVLALGGLGAIAIWANTWKNRSKASLFTSSEPPGTAASPTPVTHYSPSEPIGEQESEPPVAARENAGTEAGGNLATALKRERNHGQRLLDALSDGFAAMWKYHRPPMGSDVDGWEANVDHLLRNRHDLKRLFHYEPLEPAIAGFMPGFQDAFLHGPEKRRLKQRLHQLDLVLERL